MKSLYLMRHGKSDWLVEAGTRDEDRPLNGRGKRAAAAAGSFLADTGQRPDVVWCSHAVRARDTARRACEQGGFSGDPLELPELYLADPHAVIELVRGAPAGAERLLVVGHEPTCSSLVARLAGARTRYTTATLCRIDFDVDAWEDVAELSGNLGLLIDGRALTQLAGD